MKNLFLIMGLILISTCLPAQWVQRADIQGDILDIETAFWDRDTGSGHIYMATNGSGVFYSTDGNCWEARNNGLEDLQVIALASYPGSPHIVQAAGLTGNVYITMDYGETWILNSSGLDQVQDPYIPTGLACAYDDIQALWYTYMSTLGGGVLRQNGHMGPWSSFNSGITNKDILCIGAQSEGVGGQHQAIAGSRWRLDDAQHPSHLYYLASIENWSVVQGMPADVSYLSCAYHQVDFAVVGLSMDSSFNGQGLYSSRDTQNWAPVCTNPPNNGFMAVDYFFNNLNGKFIINAGTKFGLWSVDDPDFCGAAPYEFYFKYRGKTRAIGIGDENDAWAGGPGKGPVRYNPSDITDLPVNVRCGVDDYNILDISPTSGFPFTDTTLYAASGIGGVYKSNSLIRHDALGCGGAGYEPPGSGYFYRMIGDPDSWGTVPVIKIRPAPNYVENGCQPFQNVFAATYGKGVMFSQDGGRSWSYANGGTPSLNNMVVTDLVFHPGYDGNTNQTLFVSVYGQGVFQSDDNGASWYEVGSLPIPNPRVLSLGISPEFASDNRLFAGCRSFNIAGSEYGFYYLSDNAWISSGDAYLLSVSTMGVRGDYDTNPWVFIGTEGDGILLSVDGGDTFGPVSTGLPASSHIHDLKLSPMYKDDGTLLAGVRPTLSGEGGIYYARQVAGFTWMPINGSLPDKNVLSVAMSPQFSAEGLIFAGHATRGLYFAELGPAGPLCDWEKAGGFLGVPPDITGLSVAPDDSNLVFASTSSDGLYISRDGGDTFQPWGQGINYTSGPDVCPVETVLSVAVTQSEGGLVFLNEDFGGMTFPPVGWEIFNGGDAWTWVIDETDNPCNRDFDIFYPDLFQDNYPIIDSDCEGQYNVQDDWLVSPPLDTSTAERVLLAFNHGFFWYSGAEGGDDHGYIRVCSSETGGNCSDSGGDWVQVEDFTGPDPTYWLERANYDLTAYKGTNFRVAFHYTGSFDYYWLIDDIWLGELVPRVAVGTAGHGVFYSDYSDVTYFGEFLPSDLTTGDVNEIRYTSLSEDMRAAHSDDGEYYSPDYGKSWILSPGSPADGFTDVSFAPGAGKRLSFGDRGISSFTWGCATGYSQLKRASCTDQGSAWYYDPNNVTWLDCSTSGLDTCEDYRAILELDSNTVLMGSKGHGSSASWVGMYRSDLSCSSWAPSNLGLPDNPEIYALYQNSDPANRYVLVAVDGPGGGIFYSDESSDGRAWAATSLSASSPGTYELAATIDGSMVYSGLSGEGVWSSASTSVSPAECTAYFEVSVTEACVGDPVTFNDYSAGEVTGWEWDFDFNVNPGTDSTSSSPVDHTYTESGIYYPRLTVSNGVPSSDNYGGSGDPQVTVSDELDVGDALQAGKTGTPGEILLQWTDIDGETGYRVLASTDASAWEDELATLSADTVSYSTSAAYMFFRIQPVSVSHICGDGIIGGTW